MTKKTFAKTPNTHHRWSKCGVRLTLAACLLTGMGVMQSCDKDILTGQPEWLGNSIYERLQEGIEVDGQTKSFNYTLRLIDDLGYTTLLSKTGSRTLFVASDQSYDQWFKDNSWGVTSYDQLTLSQKKQLFNGSMIKNAYLLELMSNTAAGQNQEEPSKGTCMRRETAADLYDNVPVYKVSDFPKNDLKPEAHVNEAWSSVRSAGKDIYIFKDNTTAPMIHFLPAFMEYNNITDDDLITISNGESSSIQDSWINGKKVISAEQTCKNGYIYVIDGVMESNNNMAEIIHNNPNTQIWSKLLMRFSVPQKLNTAAQNEFWRYFPERRAAQDSIYSLSYLNKSEDHGLKVLPGSKENVNDGDLLKFDPGWNQYTVDSETMGNDAACMLVPTDDVLTEWFVNGAGKPLYQEYGSWDNISDATVAQLINVNMVESFVSSVPSKFTSIQDEAQRSMGITKNDVDKCIMGCNGVIYITNRVFQPAAFSSVLYPTTLKNETTLSVITRALNGQSVKTKEWLDFSPYLNAMDTRFSLIIPYNVKTSINPAKVKYPVLRYIDPVSYGLPSQYLMEFYYDGKQVQCRVYACTVAEDGTVTVTDTEGKTISTTNAQNVIENRLYNLIDNSIIVGALSDDQTYYKTKAGSVIKAGKVDGQQSFQGGFQLETGEYVIVPDSATYDMGQSGNGITYCVSGDANADYSKVDVPMTASKSVYQLLKEEADKGGDHLFYDLLFDSQCPLWKIQDGSYFSCLNPESNKNISLFDNYNYTIYVPTDEAIEKLINSGALPTWEQYGDASDDAVKTQISNCICDFLRYHIQDNAVYVGGDIIPNPNSEGVFESSKLNPTTNRFYPLTVTQSGSAMTVQPLYGSVCHVLSSFFNKPCREYWVESKKNSKFDTSVLRNTPYECVISSSSDAVVHKIDGVLLYSQDQLKPFTPTR